MNLQVVGKVRALGKENQMRQRECTTDDLCRLILGDLHFSSGVSHRNCLGCKRTLARKGQCIPNILDIHRLCRQQSHVTADLLEVQRRHGNARREHRLRHRDIRLIAVQEVQTILGAASLLTVLNRDRQVVRLRLGHRERDRVIVRHRLHNTVKVVRVQTHTELRSLMVVLILLKLIRIQPHVCENCTGVVHGNHPDAILIKDKAHLHQHRLKTLGEGANGGRLNSLCNHKVVHLCILEARRLSSSTHPACLATLQSSGKAIKELPFAVLAVIIDIVARKALLLCSCEALLEGLCH